MTDPEKFMAAVVKPGDTLVVGFNYHLTEEDIEALTEAWAPLGGMGVKVAFADGVADMVIIRPGEES